MKVVTHPTAELDQHLAEFKSAGTLAHLCDAIALALRYGIKTRKIGASWDDVKDDLNFRTQDILSIYRLLCLVTSPTSIERKIPNAPKLLDQNTRNEKADSISSSAADEPDGDSLMSDEIFSRLKAAVAEFSFATAQEEHDFFSRVFDDTNRYFFFSPAWEVEDHLPRAFPEENPGHVIADHLRVIFDQSDLEDESLGVFIRPKSTLSDIGVLEIVNELCERASQNIASSEEKALFDGCMDAWANGETEKFHIAAMFLPYAPQELFTLYLALYPDWSAENATQEALRLLSRFLVLDPAFFWSEEKWLRHKDKARIKKRWATLLEESRGSQTNNDDDPRHSEIVTSMLGTFGNRLVELSSSSKLQSLPRIPPPLTWHVIACFHDYLVEERADLTLRLLKSYKKYRRKHRGGRIACPFLEMSRLSYATASGSGDANDLTVNLANLLTWGHDASDGGNQDLPAFFGMCARDSDEQKNWRFEHWMDLIGSTREEGLHKLANALLSIFIFSQSIRYRGDIGDFQKLTRLVEMARKHPGAGMVDRAVSLARGLAEDYDNNVWSTYLGNITHERPNYEIALVGGIDGASNSAITQELVELLGNERWEKLCESAREFMINAQQSYDAHRNLLFSGKKTQWGALALEYIKPLEAELDHRLRKVYFRQDLAEFRRADKPTFGSYIELLKSSADFSAEAQQAIAESTSIHQDWALLKTLDKIRAYHRNPGSHIASYPPEKLDELRHEMFRQGLLESFIDHLA